MKGNGSVILGVINKLPSSCKDRLKRPRYFLKNDLLGSKNKVKIQEGSLHKLTTQSLNPLLDWCVYLIGEREYGVKHQTRVCLLNRTSRRETVVLFPRREVTPENIRTEEECISKQSLPWTSRTDFIREGGSENILGDNKRNFEVSHGL